MVRSTAYRFALVLFAGLVLLKFSPKSGFTSLIRFGETWNGHRHSSLSVLPVAVIPSSNGYDGQFYAQIALDPTLRDVELARVIDAPTYRTKRILVPALAALLGLGNPWWTLQAYSLLNVLAWLLFAWLMHRCIGCRDWSDYARWIACVFSMGAIESVRQSLVDLPALVLLLLAIEAHSRARLATSGLWLALGNLAKETSLLSALALGFDLTKQRPWRRLIFPLILCVLPLAAWSIYVHHRFPNPTSGNGLGNVTWPFLGLLDHLDICLTAVLSGNFDGRYSMGLLAVLGFAVQILVIWQTPRPAAAWWRIGAVYTLLFVVLSPWVWTGYWAVCRALLPMTIAFNLLLPGQRNFWSFWVLGNLTLLHGLWRFL